ncbi:hypothetical protein F5Y04DRAFT_196753 [Hypomontagnella monticulosa]|nr:hypothetical protein F5Y04DRAFT_196753 [Hypomontagnella monticulosa]
MFRSPFIRQFIRISHLSRPVRKFHHDQSRMSSRSSTGRTSQSRNGFAQVNFTKADIPPSSFWYTRIKPPLVQDDEVSPTECFEACTQYASLAIKDAPGWRHRNLTTSEKADDGTIPIFTLHWAAIIMLLYPFQKVVSLATHILQTGVMLGYAPSILTLARMGLERNILDKPLFAPTKEALEKLAASKKGPYTKYRPDTLTLMGIMYARLGTPAGEDQALQCFSEAENAASASGTKAEWGWRALAMKEQCEIYVRRKETTRAYELLRENIRELDNPDLCFQYAMLLDFDDPRRLTMLGKAAVSGYIPAAREMARMERVRAAAEDLTDWERFARGVRGDEWFAIAEKKAATP